MSDSGTGFFVRFFYFGFLQAARLKNEERWGCPIVGLGPCCAFLFSAIFAAGTAGIEAAGAALVVGGSSWRCEDMDTTWDQGKAAGAGGGGANSRK